jgi:lipoic acid synthetase
MNHNMESNIPAKKPPWLRQRISANTACEEVRDLLHRNRLHSVCQEALCPNLWECFSRKTATFLIMGSRCTRSCGFCAVAQGPIGLPDPNEPARVAEAAQNLKLSYIVITSVTRDDLPNGGAEHFAQTIKEIRRRTPKTLIEVLIPDFQGNATAIRTIVNARPDVLNHNLETVPRLYDAVRPDAGYRRSLNLLKLIKNYDVAMITKSGLMLGLGESFGEIRETLQDLLDVDCRLLTLGQYLQPTPNHLPVKRFVHPEEFDSWKESALEMGFDGVVSGPLVRSSYQAEKLYKAV